MHFKMDARDSVSPSLKTGHDQAVLQRRIAATYGQIDQLVYELYDLTTREIALVEAGSK